MPCLPRYSTVAACRFRPNKKQQLLFNAIVLGLSAGLWEELVRYAVLRWWAKSGRTWRRAILFGTGWEGMEAGIFGLVIFMTFINMVTLKNADLSQVVPPSQAQTIPQLQQALTTYWSSPWYLPLVGVLERLFTLPIQIALSVLVLQAFVRNRFRWVWIAVLFHAAVDFSAVLFGGLFGIAIAEAITGAFGLIVIGLIYAFRSPEPIPPLDDSSPQAPPAPLQLPEIEETPENLDRSRYN